MLPQVMCRHVVLCRVIHVLGQRLKAIMVPYFTYIMEFLLTMLGSRRSVFHQLPLLFPNPTFSAPDKAGRAPRLY